MDTADNIRNFNNFDDVCFNSLNIFSYNTAKLEMASTQ